MLLFYQTIADSADVQFVLFLLLVALAIMISLAYEVGDKKGVRRASKAYEEAILKHATREENKKYYEMQGLMNKTSINVGNLIEQYRQINSILSSFMTKEDGKYRALTATLESIYQVLKKYPGVIEEIARRDTVAAPSLMNEEVEARFNSIISFVSNEHTAARMTAEQNVRDILGAIKLVSGDAAKIAFAQLQDEMAARSKKKKTTDKNSRASR